MSVVIPVGFAQASFVFSSAEGTEPFVCTLGLDIDTAGGDYITLANALKVAWEETILEQQDTDVSLDRVSLLVGSDGGSGSIDSTIPPLSGSRSVEGAPFAMAAIARKHTASLGRSGRGRMFIPGALSSGDTSQGGAVSTTRVAALNIALSEFYDAVTGITDPGAPLPVLLHSETSSLTFPTLITGFSVAPLVGWIRKRIR